MGFHPHRTDACASGADSYLSVIGKRGGDAQVEEAETAFEKLIRESNERKVAREARQENASPPPTVRSLCLDQTLYAPIQLNPTRDANFLGRLKDDALHFDAHCVYCQQASTFRALDRVKEKDTIAEALASRSQAAKDEIKRLKLQGGQFALHVNCARNPDHLYSYFFHYHPMEAVLTKIGQSPSLEDVAGADIERYRGILGDDFVELKRATGLFAHAIGIGAFVYLRRIFENLVEAARKSADPDGLRESELLGMRMSERVQALAEHLPPAVVKYKDAYSILSKGLHELSEAECKQYFPVVRLAIINMLEQRYEAEQKAKAAADLDRAMASIMSGKNGNG